MIQACFVIDSARIETENCLRRVVKEVVFTATNKLPTIQNKVFGTTETTDDKNRESKGKNGKDQNLLLFETKDVDEEREGQEAFGSVHPRM